VNYVKQLSSRIRNNKSFGFRVVIKVIKIFYCANHSNIHELVVLGTKVSRPFHHENDSILISADWCGRCAEQERLYTETKRD